jgi:hypothetical protein
MQLPGYGGALPAAVKKEGFQRGCGAIKKRKALAIPQRQLQPAQIPLKADEMERAAFLGAGVTL